VLTCVIVLIRAWFTRAERARANTMFLLSLAVGPMIANPISGAILSISDWRWMFVIEAIPGLLWRVVWWLSIEDDPKDAAWMDPDKRASLVAALEAERREMAPLKGHWLRTLWHPALLLLALYNFLALMAEWGVNFWVPSVLKDTGLPIGMVGLLAAIPYVLGVVMMIAVAISSDRLGERKWHMVVATAAAGLFLVVIPAGGHGAFATICFLSLSIEVGTYFHHHSMGRAWFVRTRYGRRRWRCHLPPRAMPAWCLSAASGHPGPRAWRHPGRDEWTARSAASRSSSLGSRHWTAWNIMSRSR